MNILTLESKHWKDVEGVSREEIASAVEYAANEAKALLPSDLPYTNIMIEPEIAENVIPETGDMGMTYDDSHIYITFDVTVPYGKDSLLKHLRSTTYHELTHAVTFEHTPWQPGVLYGAITEGLATVFERNYANSAPLWGKYESDEIMHAWLKELKDLPETEIKDKNYFVEHTDGRKWIVYKTGVWIIDKLMGSGEDLFNLMGQSPTELLDQFSRLSK